MFLKAKLCKETSEAWVSLLHTVLSCISCLMRRHRKLTHIVNLGQVEKALQLYENKGNIESPIQPGDLVPLKTWKEGSPEDQYNRNGGATIWYR
ncbi:hypothetical protein AAY473_037015 [Plecturocebus cupreus]